MRTLNAAQTQTSRSITAGLALALMLGSLSACTQSRNADSNSSKNSKAPSETLIEGTIANPAVAPVPGEGGSWTLRWTSTCTDGSTSCPGALGFTVSSDGNWSVGPATTGDVYSGELEIAERIELSSRILPFLNAAGEQSRCSPSEEAANWSISNADLVLDQSGRKVLNLNSAELCSSAEAGTAKEVATLVLGFASKYQPAVFPDECLSLATNLEKDYEPLRQCQQDSDCAWLDFTFSPIATDEVQFVMTDACSKLRPLVAANRALMADPVIEKLQAARNNLVDTCGAALARTNCEGIGGFESTLARPVCDLGRCKMPPLDVSRYITTRR